MKYRTFHAVKIGLLAVDLGVRFITVDALYDFDVEPAYDASGFYEKLGFEFADPTESLPPVNPYRIMYLDLKPLIETLAVEELDEAQL